jgi:hypothetical protein
MMMKISNHAIPGYLILFFSLTACQSNEPSQEELVNDPYLSVQKEISEVINSIVKDAEEANIEGLKSAHL